SIVCPVLTSQSFLLEINSLGWLFGYDLQHHFGRNVCVCVCICIICVCVCVCVGVCVVVCVGCGGVGVCVCVCVLVACVCSGARLRWVRVGPKGKPRSNAS